MFNAIVNLYDIRKFEMHPFYFFIFFQNTNSFLRGVSLPLVQGLYKILHPSDISLYLLYEL